MNFVEDTKLRESQTKTLYTKDKPKLSELLLNKLSEFNVVELPIQIQLLKYEVGDHLINIEILYLNTTHNHHVIQQ